MTVKNFLKRFSGAGSMNGTWWCARGIFPCSPRHMLRHQLQPAETQRRGSGTKPAPQRCQTA